MIDSGHGMLDQVRQAVVRRAEHLKHDVERRHFRRVFTPYRIDLERKTG